MPLYTSPVIGVREWDIYPPAILYGLYVSSPWHKQEQTAACLLVDTDHEAPSEGCACGLYAFNNLACAKTFGDCESDIWLVRGRGIVSAWGKICVHDYGFRAEHMRIEALLEPPPPAPPSIIDDLYAAAIRYGVPVIAEGQAALFIDHLEGIVLPRIPSPVHPEKGRGTGFYCLAHAVLAGVFALLLYSATGHDGLVFNALSVLCGMNVGINLTLSYAYYLRRSKR